MDKALIYCRVSSERQVNEGHGLDSQEHRCKERAKTKGYNVASVFRDEGVSGSIADRPAIRELLAYLDKDSDEKYVILIDDLSRLDRDVQVHTVLRGALRERGARLECLNMELDDDNELSEAMENIAVVFNQLHRKTNQKQVIQRQKARIEAGYWTFCPPRGLIFIKDPIHGKLLSWVEPWATIIKQAIEGYSNGLFLTLYEVKNNINLEIKNREIKHKVSIESVRRMLTNILYTGYIEYKPWGIIRRDGHHKGFITLETYNRVQDILSGRSKPRLRKDYNSDFPLRRLVICSDCNKPLTASWNTGRSKRYANYFCKTKECPMRNKTISKDILERDFASLLEKVTIPKEVSILAKEVLNDVWNQHQEASDGHKKATEKQIQGLNTQIDNLVSRVAKTDNNDVVRAYEKQIEDLAQLKTKLGADSGVRSYDDTEFGTAFDTVMATLSNPLSVWKSDRLEDKQTIVYMYFAEKLSYQKGCGFGTVRLEPNIELINNIGEQKTNLVEVVGIEPTSEIVIIKHLQA